MSITTKSKQCYYHVMSSVVEATTTALGGLYAPWTRKKTSYEDVLKIREVAERGDILLTRKRGELSTIMIPGIWKHTAVILSDDEVTEAVGKGVDDNYLVNLILKSDYYCILRTKDMTKAQVERLVEKAATYKGRRYDFGLRLWNEDEVYCSEIIFHGLNYAMERQILKPVERFGYPTFSPDDIFENSEVFDIILTNWE